MAMGLWLGMPGIRGLGEAGVGVESLAKDGAEVGIGDNDAAEVESFVDGSLTEDRVGAKSLACAISLLTLHRSLVLSLAQANCLIGRRAPFVSHHPF